MVIEYYFEDGLYREHIVWQITQTLPANISKKCINRLILCLYKPKTLLLETIWNFAANPGVFGEVLCETEQKINPGDFPECFSNATLLNKKKHTRGRLYFHTFKCTSYSLDEQIAWTFRKIGNGCVMDKIYKHLAQYEDFGGLYCTWTGNKSIHIHTRWDVSKLKVPAIYFYDVVIASYWKALGKEIAAIIKQHRCISVNFDKTLRMPRQCRRLSWGKRKIIKDGELFKVGTTIPQVELWSKQRSTGCPQEDNCFHKPQPFHAEYKKIVKKPRSYQWNL